MVNKVLLLRVQRYLTLDDTRKYWFSNCIFYSIQVVKCIGKCISSIFVFKIRIILGDIDMKIRVIKKSKHKLPEYSTKTSAGIDVWANLEEKIILKPMERVMVPTGWFLEFPEGYEAQIRPGSGLDIKKGITNSEFSGNNRCLITVEKFALIL